MQLLRSYTGTLGRKPVELVYYTYPPGAVCSVACLEWEMRIEESLAGAMAIVKASLLLKYLLQKRLRDGLTAVENT